MITNIFILGMCAVAGGYVGYIIRDISANDDHQPVKVSDINDDVVDMVNKPPHYILSNGIESIDVIKGVLTEEQYFGWCKGNALKYILRAGKKDISKIKEDYRKSGFHLNEIDKLLE